MEESQLKVLAAKVIMELSAAVHDLRTVKGVNLNGIRGLFNIAPIIVRHVEEISKDLSLSGEDKKALAVECIVQWVPLPKWLPDFIARPLLSYAIERAVAAMKSKMPN